MAPKGKPMSIQVKEGVDSCFQCKGSHSPLHCPQLKVMTGQAIRSLLWQHKLCFRCFSAEHTSSHCQAQVSCDACRRTNHNTLLHKDSPPSVRNRHAQGGSMLRPAWGAKAKAD